MAALRATSLRLGARQASATPKQTRRNLHITGAATLPSPALKLSKPTKNASLPSDIATLRAECKSRKLSISGNEADLIERLTFDTVRSYTAPAILSTTSRSTANPTSPPQSRALNTSRALKSPHDSSPVDFAFLPATPAESSPTTDLRVPLVPTNYTPTRTGAHAPLPDGFSTVVHRPEISTMAADSTHVSAPSAMSDVLDNNAHNVDFHAVAERLNRTAREMGKEVEREAEVAGGFVRALWNGLLDDVFNGGDAGGRGGARKGKGGAAGGAA